MNLTRMNLKQTNMNIGIGNFNCFNNKGKSLVSQLWKEDLQ